MQSDLRREKANWNEHCGQGGIPWVDDIDAPTARTRFASVQHRIPIPWGRDKQSAPSTPSADGADGTNSIPLSHKPTSDHDVEATAAGPELAPDEVPANEASAATTEQTTEKAAEQAPH